MVHNFTCQNKRIKWPTLRSTAVDDVPAACTPLLFSIFICNNMDDYRNQVVNW